MEGKTMTLAKLSSDNYRNSWFPAMPSFFDKFFEGDLMDWRNFNFAGTNSTLPAVNVKENENEYQIEVAAPGFQKEDFRLSFENGRLMISSEKKEKKEEKEGGKITQREFNYQSFQRTFTVPEELVNSAKIVAKYNDGILHVTLPKREEVKPKPAREIKIL